MVKYYKEKYHELKEFMIRWQKPLQYCKVISLQLIKINAKKNLKIKIKILERVKKKKKMKYLKLAR